MTKTLSEIVAAIPVGDRPARYQPNLRKRKPTNARVCHCGEHWFAYTSLCWIAIVDAENGWLLRDYKWTAKGQALNWAFYAYSPRYRQETGQSARLHRAVMGHAHEQYDHANGNGHDCRKGNLRPCTGSQNQWNRKAYRDVTSKYKGVYRAGSRWQAQITVDGQQVHLGAFGFESDAAICFNIHAAYYHGEFAKLNKIEEYFHD
jgi:hypothetical protein